MEKQIGKCSGASGHIYRENYTTTNINHKQRPHITKYLFQYETTIAAFNIKFRSVMNSFQLQCASHARILRHQQQYQHSITKIYSIDPHMYLTRIKKCISIIPFLPVTSSVPLNNVRGHSHIESFHSLHHIDASGWVGLAL